MAFKSTLTPCGLICIGFGTPTVDVTGSTTAGSPTAVTVTSFQGSGITRYGWIKMVLYGITSLVPTHVDITGTDGNTTRSLFNTTLTSATSGQGLEYLIPYMSELNLTSVTVTVTHTGSTTPQLDVEIVGNP